MSNRKNTSRPQIGTVKIDRRWPRLEILVLDDRWPGDEFTLKGSATKVRPEARRSR